MTIGKVEISLSNRVAQMGRHPGHRLAAWSSPHRGKRLWSRPGADTAGTRSLLSGLGFGVTLIKQGDD